MSTCIRLGVIDLSFHAASAAVISAVLEKYGYTVQTTVAPHEEMFQKLSNGEVDLLVSAWLPSSHGKYIHGSATMIRSLGVLYHPYCFWGVPSYVPQELVDSVADLRKPSVGVLMNREIRGINPGAGISRFSVQAMKDYALDDVGYRFITGSEKDCYDAFEAAYADGRWTVVPLWHPHYLHQRYRIRELSDPLGVFGGTDAATLIGRSDALSNIDSATLDALSNLHLGNDAVSRIDYLTRTQAAHPRTAVYEVTGI